MTQREQNQRHLAAHLRRRLNQRHPQGTFVHTLIQTLTDAQLLDLFVESEQKRTATPAEKKEAHHE